MNLEKKTGVILAMLFLSVLCMNPVLGETRITEIMYDLEGSDDGREWIEVYSDEPINLSKWKFFEGGTNHNIKLIQGSDTFSGYAVITDDSIKFMSDNPSFSGNLFDSTFSLRNDNETIALKINASDIVFEITYFSESGGKGNGKSLQYYAGKWCEGMPTPGKENACQEKEEEEKEEAFAPEQNTTYQNNSQQSTLQQNLPQNNITKITEQTYNVSEKQDKETVSIKAEDTPNYQYPVPKNNTSNATKPITSKVVADAPEEEEEKKVIYQSKNERIKQGTIYLLGALLILLVVYLIRNNKV